MGIYSSKVVDALTEWLFYFIIEHNEKIYVRKRGTKDIWENLYEFVLIESSGATDLEQLKKLPEFNKLLRKAVFSIETISKLYSQKLTHQTIHGQFIKIKLPKPVQLEGYELVSEKKLALLPFPKFITTYLKDKNVSLNLL